MNRRLNTWQRFWMLFAAVFLASTLALIATLWPPHDPAVVADLGAPECREWRELPEGTFPEDYPEATNQDQCHSLRTLLNEQRINIRNQGDYDRYLLKERARVSMICLAWWAGFVATIYLLGWASRRLVDALRGKKSPQAS
ncbi:MAG: hypothetical protein R3F24_09375 [Gammaproteobacteria bacterium]